MDYNQLKTKVEDFIKKRVEYSKKINKMNKYIKTTMTIYGILLLAATHIYNYLVWKGIGEGDASSGWFLLIVPFYILFIFSIGVLIGVGILTILKLLSIPAKYTLLEEEINIMNNITNDNNFSSKYFRNLFRSFSIGLFLILCYIISLILGLIIGLFFPLGAYINFESITFSLIVYIPVIILIFLLWRRNKISIFSLANCISIYNPDKSAYKCVLTAANFLKKNKDINFLFKYFFPYKDLVAIVIYENYFKEKAESV